MDGFRLSFGKAHRSRGGYPVTPLYPSVDQAVEQPSLMYGRGTANELNA